ncbi:MAG: universal stress protein [Acidimicrobiales bacterium]
MARILVGLDGSETARAAFREAVREAVWRECAVHAIHVVHYPVVTGHEFGHVDYEAFQTAGKATLTDELAALEKEYEGGAFPVEVDSAVLMGHTGVEMLRLAERGIGATADADGEPVDLVVVGSRGLGGFRGLLLGSVTTYLTHHLAGPLLIVPDRRDGE